MWLIRGGGMNTDKIYIAGPMQGIKDFNFPAFDFAATEWRDAGWEVFSPAERDRDVHGEDMNISPCGELEDIEHTGFDLRQALAADLEWIAMNATAIYMLRGWENSKGARAEHALAVALSLEIFYE